MRSEDATGSFSDRRLPGSLICLVGINYAPEPTGSAPYTTALAEMLVANGAEVEVVTGVPHYPSWRVDPAYRWRLRATETINGVRVLRARHAVPRRLTGLTRLLWDGTFVLNGGMVRPSRRPELVLASTPSIGAGLLGRRLADRYDVPFGIVVQDLLGRPVPHCGLEVGSPFATLVTRLEARVLRAADVVAVTSDAFRDQVQACGVPAERIRELRNWAHLRPARRDRATVRRELGWDDGTFVVLHTGTMGRKQDLGNVIEAAWAISATADPGRGGTAAGDGGVLHRDRPGVSGRGGDDGSDRGDVRIVLMGDGSQHAALAEEGRRIPSLEFRPPVPDDLYPDVLRAADLLLVNERAVEAEPSLPSKLTSYLAAGRPVLAAVPATGACTRELVATGGAARRVEPGDPAALAAAIRELQRQPHVLAFMGRAAAGYARDVLNPADAERRVLDLAAELLLTGRVPVQDPVR